MKCPLDPSLADAITNETSPVDSDEEEDEGE